MPTVARGVASVSLLAGAWVLVLALGRLWPAAAPSVPAWCSAPIEISTADGRGRLACASDTDVQDCGPLVAGDRVGRTQAAVCTLHPQGMRAGWRLLRGLKLDINRVSVADLELLDGVGRKTATAIVAYRDRLGQLQNLRELQHVRGVGPKTVAKLSELLAVPEPAPPLRSGKREGCKALPGQSIGEKCNVDG